MADKGIRPAVDLNRTTSSLNPRDSWWSTLFIKCRGSADTRKYESLKSIIAIIGEMNYRLMTGLIYNKAKALIDNFTQSMFVMERATGRKGEYFTIDQTLQSVEEIIA